MIDCYFWYSNEITCLGMADDVCLTIVPAPRGVLANGLVSMTLFRACKRHLFWSLKRLLFDAGFRLLNDVVYARM